MGDKKVRLTIGNVLGILTATAGLVVAHSDVLIATNPKIGNALVIVAAAILALSKNVFTGDAAKIPDDHKVDAGPVVLQKTTILKPETE